MSKPKEPEDDGRHPWASSVDRYPDDELLRRHGFSISIRREGSEPVWYHRGRARPVTQTEAIRMVAEGKV